MNLGLWPIRVRIALPLLLWAALFILAWATVRSGREVAAPRYDEPEDGVQPGDLRVLWLSDNLTAADGGPVSIRWRQ